MKENAGILLAVMDFLLVIGLTMVLMAYTPAGSLWRLLGIAGIMGFIVAFNMLATIPQLNEKETEDV